MESNERINVFVRHYLTPEGIRYFKSNWFPLVYAIINKQEGFLKLTHEIVDECVNLTLQFKDKETFDAWVIHPCHDDLVDALDPYRSRNDWQVVQANEESPDLSKLEWTTILRQNGELKLSEHIFGNFWEQQQLRNPGVSLDKRTIHDLRAGTHTFLQYGVIAPEISYSETTIPARDGSPLKIRIYNDQLPKNTPVMIFYPGCAFVFDLFEVNGMICSRIARAAGIKVILVQYRLAPEHPMPTSIYDGYDGARYISKNPEIFGIDPNKIFLGGWCSGAQCAAAISRIAIKEEPLKIFHQILLGGCYDLAESNTGFDTYEQQDKILSREFLRHITSHYYGISKNEYKNPIISPYFETNYEEFPSTTLLVGEYDALRNDSEAYFKKLIDAEVKVEKIVLSRQTHNTIAMRKVLTDGTDPAEIIANVITRKLKD